MAVSNNKLADALAFQQERRKALASADEALANLFANRQIQPEPKLSTSDYLENLSSGLGRGFANQLEGTYQLARHPIESGKAMYQAGKQIAQNPAMLAEALKSIGQQATSGPLGLGQIAGEYINPRSLMPKSVIQEMTAYHGTPHKFPVTESNPLGEFDASKIGTGEGAQAYGHGLYFAESPEVAGSYRVALSYDPDKMRIGGKQINSVYDAISRNVGKMPPKQASGEYEKLELLERLMMNDSLDTVSKHAVEMSPSTLAWFEKQVKPNFQTYGSLYTVDLPDEMVDRMLDWDKPLSEQTEAVKAAARKIGLGKSVAKGPTRVKLQAFLNGTENPERGIVATGEDLYRAASDYGADSIGGSKFLHSMGIPGIRYLDQGSRGAGQGTRNFVVFPGEEKKVKILKRE